MASRLFTVDLDLGLNKARRFIFEDFSTNPTGTTGRVIYWTAGDSSANHLKVYNGTAWKTLAYTDDAPTVSISLDAPDLFTVSGSPASATGTLAFEWNTAAVNTVLAGPGTGSTAAIPTFRSLVAADIPSLSSIYQPLDGDLTSIAGLTGTSGLLKKTAANTYELDTTAYAPIVNPVFTSNVEIEGDLKFDVIDGTPTGSISILNGPGYNMLRVSASDWLSLSAANNITLTSVNALISLETGDKVVISGTNGEFLNNHTVADNQIATIGDVNSKAPIDNPVFTGTVTVPTSIVFEGATADAYETTLTVVDPTDEDRTITLPNASGTVALFDGSGNLTVPGNLTVSGDTTTLNTATVLVEDNIFVLSSGATGTPSVNSGIEVERGDSTNASFLWNESVDAWQAGLVGSEVSISLAGHTHSTSDITGLQEYVEDTVATAFTDSTTIDFTYTDNSTSAGTITAAVLLAASNPYLSTTSGLAVDISALETKLTTDGYVKKYATAISGSETSYTITHSLNTRDVTVQVYETASPYAQVETAIEHATVNTVTVYFNTAPADGAYRVVVTG
jgi:hypothetical protein